MTRSSIYEFPKEKKVKKPKVKKEKPKKVAKKEEKPDLPKHRGSKKRRNAIIATGLIAAVLSFFIFTSFFQAQFNDGLDLSDPSSLGDDFHYVNFDMSDCVKSSFPLLLQSDLFNITNNIEFYISGQKATHTIFSIPTHTISPFENFTFNRRASSCCGNTNEFNLASVESKDLHASNFRVFFDISDYCIPSWVNFKLNFDLELISSDVVNLSVYHEDFGKHQLIYSNSFDSGLNLSASPTFSGSNSNLIDIQYFFESNSSFRLSLADIELVLSRTENANERIYWIDAPSNVFGLQDINIVLNFSNLVNLDLGYKILNITKVNLTKTILIDNYAPEIDYNIDSNYLNYSLFDFDESFYSYSYFETESDYSNSILEPGDYYQNITLEEKINFLIVSVDRAGNINIEPIHFEREVYVQNQDQDEFYSLVASIVFVVFLSSGASATVFYVYKKNKGREKLISEKEVYVFEKDANKSGDKVVRALSGFKVTEKMHRQRELEFKKRVLHDMKKNLEEEKECEKKKGLVKKIRKRFS